MLIEQVFPLRLQGKGILNFKKKLGRSKSDATVNHSDRSGERGVPALMLAAAVPLLCSIVPDADAGSVASENVQFLEGKVYHPRQLDAALGERCDSCSAILVILGLWHLVSLCVCLSAAPFILWQT